MKKSWVDFPVSDPYSPFVGVICDFFACNGEPVDVRMLPEVVLLNHGWKERAEGRV